VEEHEGTGSEKDEVSLDQLPRLVEELLGVVQGTTITELLVEYEGLRVRIQREPSGALEELAREPRQSEEARTDGVVVVTSGYVGVFRRDPEAQLPAVGDQVAEGSKIAEVETLRMRNPVIATADGVLSAFLVEHEAAVEYGQPLALIRSSPRLQGPPDATDTVA
jgi:biotin carboxyl carrier protein